ncbi:7169_t:CDS:2, partial [Funneliformis geosporum]
RLYSTILKDNEESIWARPFELYYTVIIHIRHGLKMRGGNSIASHANNLYGWAMSQYLLTGGFKWLDLNNLLDIRSISPTAKRGSA